MTAFQGLLLIAVLVSVLAAVWDYKTGLIPNGITYPLLAGGAVLHFTTSAISFPEAARALLLAETLIGILSCAVVPLLLWRAKGLGAGDAKLLAGIGATLGPRIGLTAELYAFWAAAIIAPVVLAYRGVFWATLQSAFRLMLRPFLKHPPKLDRARLAELRFGPAIALGTMLAALLEWS